MKAGSGSTVEGRGFSRAADARLNMRTFSRLSSLR